jgi:hypothetical protein
MKSITLDNSIINLNNVIFVSLEDLKDTGSYYRYALRFHFVGGAVRDFYQTSDLKKIEAMFEFINIQMGGC